MRLVDGQVDHPVVRAVLHDPVQQPAGGWPPGRLEQPADERMLENLLYVLVAQNLYDGPHRGGGFAHRPGRPSAGAVSQVPTRIGMPARLTRSRTTSPGQEVVSDELPAGCGRARPCG